MDGGVNVPVCKALEPGLNEADPRQITPNLVGWGHARHSFTVLVVPLFEGRPLDDARTMA